MRTWSFIKPYWCLMRFDRPVGIVLLLWPTWWALWLAERGLPPLGVLSWMTLGVIVMRALGCVINDCCDYRFDRHVKRTCSRPLAQSQVPLSHAWILALLLAFCALFIVLQFNQLTVYLSFFGLAMTLLYPLTKRFFPCPQFILGLTFAWGIPMAYAALLNDVPNDAWMLYGLAALWILIYDTQYAMVDLDDDLLLGLRSSARWFGRYERAILAVLMLILGVLWLVFARAMSLSQYFYGFWLFMFVAFAYQLKLLWTRERENCFRAFLSNQWWGGLVWLALVCSL